MTMFKRAALAAATIALAAAPAFSAQPESGTRAIRYGDLNLATAQGVNTLHHRIAAALEAVCGSYAGTDTAAGAEESRDIARCRATAQAQADRSVAVIVSAHAQLASVH